MQTEPGGREGATRQRSSVSVPHAGVLRRLTDTAASDSAAPQPNGAGTTVVEPAAPGGSRERWLLRNRDALIAAGVYLVTAVFVTIQLWVSAGRMVVTGPGRSDLMVFEWFMAHGARVFTDLQDPFFTDRMNAPLGVNMIANTSVLGLSIPLAPVTLLFGPFISVLVALVVSLAGTASAWYYVLSRHIVTSRLGAFVGAGFCGFAPAMISQANGHVNFIAQFVVPLLLLQVLRLGRPGRVIRDGAVLAALVVWQALINQELLLFTAIGCLVLAIVWSLANREQARLRWRPFVGSLAVTAVVSLIALAYPFYVQFFGRQAYTTLPIDPADYYSDVGSYFLFSSESLAGNRDLAGYYADNTSEENTFLGLPLMILIGVLAVWLWRVTAARAAILIAAVFGSVSLGREIVVFHYHTGVPAPYRLLSKLPLFELSLPSRYALAVAPMVGILLAIAFECIDGAEWLRRLVRSWPPRFVLGAATLVALLPVAPTPLAVEPLPRVPHFISSGAWEPYVADGGTVVGVPIASGMRWSVGTLRWSSVTGMDPVMPGGYFLGPRSEFDRRALFTSPPRPTSTLLDGVAKTGAKRLVDDRVRATAREDLRYWKAAIVVLGDHVHEKALRETLNSLLGPGQQVDDVWVWDVRSITATT